jgi:RNA polymerase sigma-70 factor (ECF subfamily)
MSFKPEDLDDRALVERFQRTGDHDCFVKLFERHRKRIYGLCRRLVSNDALAEELMQETFMNAFKGIRGFKNEGSPFGAWLNTIARNLCLSELRKYRPEPLPVDPPANPSREMEPMPHFHELQAVLDQMDEGPRRCWMLYQIEGYSYQEIERLMGYPKNEVRNNLLIARRRLRKLRT